MLKPLAVCRTGPFSPVIINVVLRISVAVLTSRKQRLTVLGAVLSAFVRKFGDLSHRFSFLFLIKSCIRLILFQTLLRKLCQTVYMIRQDFVKTNDLFVWF